MDQNTQEVRLLFKHLLLFLLVALVLRLWNMFLFVSFPWSQFIIVPWIVILSVHLLLFFMSTGIIGQEYENIPVKTLARNLLKMVKERNLRFKESLNRPSSPPNNVNN